MAGYLFLQSQRSQIVQVLVAIVWGVGGVALLYVVTNWLVMKLPKRASKLSSPCFCWSCCGDYGLVFGNPGVSFTGCQLQKLFRYGGVGFENYKFAFTDPHVRDFPQQFVVADLVQPSA